MPLEIVDGPTIPMGESLSDGVDCTGGHIVRITVPKEFTESNLTFQVSSNGDSVQYSRAIGQEVECVTTDTNIIINLIRWARYQLGQVQVRDA